jgi:hypothetical protein
MKLPSNNAVFQNAWVVVDLQAAMRRWIDFYGIGPFYVLDHLDLTTSLYRGRKSDLVLSVGIAQAGPVQIELIEQHSKGPSVYRDSVPEGATGFHHVCLYSDDFDADKAYFERAGYATALEGGAPDGSVRYGYFDTRRDFDVFTEIITASPAVLARNEMITRASVDWDGSDPIRIITADGYKVP